MVIKSTMDKACPNLIFEGIDTTNNKLRVTPEGWKFWEHTDPVGHVTNVQFCKLIGRKRDVFECINECEWKCCVHRKQELRDEIARAELYGEVANFPIAQLGAKAKRGLIRGLVDAIIKRWNDLFKRCKRR